MRMKNKTPKNRRMKQKKHYICKTNIKAWCVIAIYKKYASKTDVRYAGFEN